MKQGAEALEEHIFLDESGVTVTNSRFVVRGQTYAMGGITSVESSKRSPSMAAPGCLMMIGLIGLLSFSKAGFIIGILVLGLGIAIVALQRPTYTVVLTAASGEVKALSSGNEGFISRVVKALNDAIIARG